MISDRQRAVAVSEAAEEFIKQLSLALKAVQENGSHEDVERLRKSIGEVVGTVEAALLWPLYKQHPDLEPEDLKGVEEGS
jgi:transcriptional regulator of aromatic amino acid metabolism